MRIYALYSIKGGVGKTASAVNLAYLSAREGARTLLWDLDPQGAASFYLRVEARIRGGGKGLVKGKRPLEEHLRASDYEGLDLLPADFSYRHLDRALDGAKKKRRVLARLLQELEGAYDHVFVDCAPSISLVSESLFVAADVLLVPVIPTPLSLRTLEQLRHHLAEHGPQRLQVLPFLAMVDRRKGLHRRLVEELAEGGHHPLRTPAGYLRTVVPYASQIEQMGIHRAPLGAFAAASPPALAYEELWRSLRP